MVKHSHYWHCSEQEIIDQYEEFREKQRRSNDVGNRKRETTPIDLPTYSAADCAENYLSSKKAVDKQRTVSKVSTDDSVSANGEVRAQAVSGG